MRRKRFSAEQIVGILKQAKGEVPVAVLCRQAGITDQTSWRWKKRHVGLEVGQVRQVKQLQEEDDNERKPCRMLGLHLDITECKQADHALPEYE